ncbi:MAG TPA: DegV family protein [Gaiellaceae bacterium]|nr:DegV family protein [Gaiellaceae bacterium]
MPPTLTAENTAIVLDSTAGLASPGDRHANWRLVPLYLRLGDETFLDVVEIGPDEFFRRMRASAEQPRSSQPSPGDFSAVYESLSDYERIVSIHISEKLSGTCQSAHLAAAGQDGRVTVVDSQTVAAGIVLLAEALQERLERGTSDEELAVAVEEHRRNARFVYTLQTLDYLVRGGRVGRAAGLASQLLDTKPVIEIREGENAPVKRVRGRAKALAELERLLAASVREAGVARAAVVHAEAPSEGERVAGEVRRLVPGLAVELFEFSPVVATNTGPGAVGVAWSP